MKVMQHVADIQNSYADAISYLDTLREQKKALKKSGIKYGAPSYKEGKYLRIVHPDTDGKGRKFEYIGADPTKQKAVLDRIERGKAYDAIDRRIVELEGKLASLSNELFHVSMDFKRTIELMRD